MSEEIKPDVIQTSDVEQSGAQSFGESVMEKLSGISDKVAAAADVIKEKVADIAEDAVEAAGPVTEKLSGLSDKVAAAADSIKEKVSKMAGDLVADAQAKDAAEADPAVNYSEKTLAELSGLFEELMGKEDRMKRSKEAEAIKSAFYKRLSKEKAAAGLSAEVEEPGDDVESVEEPSAEEAVVKDNPFEAIESGFKSLYNTFKKERAEFNRRQEAERQDNLVKKQAVIEDLKALVEKSEDVGAAFPEFRAIQARWREIGQVPVQDFRGINETYQLYVTQFYDKVQINRDMRDLDFKKNLEAKEELCQEAEQLSGSEDVIGSFKDLQKLHEQWKELGPVAKEYRDQIWDRFKAATAVINKKYQAYFEGQKEKFAENLAAKTRLCEQVEEILTRDDIKSSSDWNNLSKEIENIQQEWRKIGFATRKDNQKIYDRFRAACDRFYERKREYYSQFKDSMNGNLEKKLSLIEQAEALKDSTEWKKTADKFIELQKQWKEIGAVPRKKSEQLWKRFRAACDAFFAERDKQAKPENDFYGNLRQKKALIEEINAFQPAEGQDLREAMNAFTERWQAIGFVPFKEKEAVAQAYKEAMQAKFPEFGNRRSSARGAGSRPAKAPLSEKDRLVQQYNALQQEIDTYENNIGFFSASKNSAPLIEQMRARIDAAKKDLQDLADRIRQAESSEQE